MTEVPLHVPAYEGDTLRLFGVESGSAEAEGLRQAVAEEDGAALAAALGVEQVDPDRVELVTLKDLGGMGLSNYLSAGYGVPQAQLEAAAGQLGNAPAQVLLVTSAAFGGRAQTLRPGPALTPLASFSLAEPMPDREPMRGHPAPDESRAAPRGPETPPPGPERRGPGLVIGALGTLLLLIVLAWLFL